MKKFKGMKKLLSLGMSLTIILSVFSVPASASTIAANVGVVSGKSNYNNNWYRTICYITYQGNRVGTVDGQFSDGWFSDKVYTKVSSPNGYKKYATICSVSAKSSPDTLIGDAVTDEITLRNYSAQFGGGVYVG